MVANNMKKNEKKSLLLTDYFFSLDPLYQETLLEFAEFLYKKHGEKRTQKISRPAAIPRPEKESVIAAMKRLNQTYPMLNKQKILEPASDLLSAHLLKGENAFNTIEKLEQLFMEEYQKLFDQSNSSSLKTDKRKK